ncbi:MAG: hypothetical protein V4548_12670 [Bacteroidota bacterium]
MDLQTRKILFVQEFLKIESDKVISHLEKMLQKQTQTHSEIKPITNQELQKRIDQSLDDSKKGRLTENSKLISEIEKWS